MTKTTFTAVLLAALAGPLSHPQAACKLSDLTGEWSSFSVGQADTGESGVQECTVHINRTGKFRAGSRCVDDSTLKTAGLRVTNSCGITGTFEQRFPGLGRITCEMSAALSPSKEIASGLLRCRNGDARAVSLLNMVRR